MAAVLMLGCSHALNSFSVRPLSAWKWDAGLMQLISTPSTSRDRGGGRTYIFKYLYLNISIFLHVQGAESLTVDLEAVCQEGIQKEIQGSV